MARFLEHGDIIFRRDPESPDEHRRRPYYYKGKSKTSVGRILVRSVVEGIGPATAVYPVAEFEWQDETKVKPKEG